MTSTPLSPDAAARVADSRIGWLTTLRPDGSPHTTPVWFVYLEQAIWIASAISNVKVRNLRADARVSVAVDGSAAAPLVAQGTAELRETTDDNEDLLPAFAAKYDGWDVTDQTVEGPRVIVKISVARWLLAG